MRSGRGHRNSLSEDIVPSEFAEACNRFTGNQPASAFCFHRGKADCRRARVRLPQLLRVRARRESERLRSRACLTRAGRRVARIRRAAHLRAGHAAPRAARAARQDGQARWRRRRHRARHQAGGARADAAQTGALPVAPRRPVVRGQSLRRHGQTAFRLFRLSS